MDDWWLGGYNFPSKSKESSGCLSNVLHQGFGSGSAGEQQFLSAPREATGASVKNRHGDDGADMGKMEITMPDAVITIKIGAKKITIKIGALNRVVYDCFNMF